MRKWHKGVFLGLIAREGRTRDELTLFVVINISKMLTTEYDFWFGALDRLVATRFQNRPRTRFSPPFATSLYKSL